MKKILFVLAIIMISMTSWAEEKVNWTDVSTAQDFYNAIKNNSAANVRLTKDIDISSLTETSDGYLFKHDGGFQGNITGENSSGRDYALMNGTHGLFYHLSGANISHLALRGFCVTGVTAIVSRTSSGCNFSHIIVKNSSLNAKKSGYNIGMITGWSMNDQFDRCYIWGGCSVETQYNKVGGIAGYVEDGSFFNFCWNGGTVKSTDSSIWSTVDSYAGGILGYGHKNTVLHNCLNTGEITGENYEGGIVGYIANGTLERCVNTARIKALSSDSHKRAGIAGEAKYDDLVDCINFGDIDKAETTGFGECTNSIVGTDSEIEFEEGTLYHAVVDGECLDNLSSANTSYEEILSGKYANIATDYCYEENWLYQDIDNNTFCTKYPVPIPEAGIVYSNILCDGTQSYSNKYKSTGIHNGVADQYGRCTICGNIIGSVASDIHIKDAEGLMRVAYEINNGTDCSKSIIYLDNDIDMKGCSYTPIGTSTYPFCGDFNGQGHRVKNLVIYGEKNPVGLLGYITDSYVENVVVDSTCAFYNTSNGTAGVVGCTTKPISGTFSHISIMNCGNEATVSSTGVNSGGIVGGVYENDNTELYITNCYNSGAIKGASESAAIIGYGRKYTYLENCWNSAPVSGVTNNMSLWYTNVSGNKCSATTCYDVNGQSGTTKLTADNLSLGIFCGTLNINRAEMNRTAFGNPYYAWTQNIGTDAHPTFGDAGIHYARTMPNRWGTVCLPFAIKSGEGYELYALKSVANDALTLTKVTGTLDAGTPAIVYSNASSADIDIPAISSSLEESAFATTPVIGSSANGLTLTGTYATVELASNTGYFIANNAFWNISNYSISCPAFHAYLAGSITGNAKQLTINLNDDAATDINSLAAEGDWGEAYDLNGRRLNNLQHGVNIVRMPDGTTKKIIVK